MSSEFEGKSVVVFCPTFFDYDIRIRDKLEEMGANVLLFDERPSKNPFVKAVIRLRFVPLMHPIVSYYYYRIIRSLAGRQSDHLLVVNPECMTPGILSRLVAVLGAKKATVFMWDSLSNKPSARALIPHVDSFFTFDSTDAAADERLKYLPLFSAFSGSKTGGCEPVDISFFGTLHSDRYAVCKAIERRAEMSGLTTRFFFFVPSRIYFFVRRFFDAGFRQVDVKDVSFVPLPLSEIESQMLASKAVLDIQHPGQVGLTMRTIESLEAECKLITTNPEVSNHDFFRPDNVLIVDRMQPELDSEFFSIPYRKLPRHTVERYSISNWLITILGD